MNIQPVEVLITLQFAPALLNELKELSSRLHITVYPARKAEEIPADIWSRAEIIYTDRVLPAPQQVPNLRWLQFHYAGIENALDSALFQKSDLAITTLSGAAAPQMAEYALTMMLALGHHLPDLRINQEKAEWPRDRYDRFHARELRSSVVGLIGYGSIGREIARLLQPLQTTILAVKRDVMHPTDPGYMPAGLGDSEGNLFHRLYPIQALRSMLKECDYAIVTLPLSTATRGLIQMDDLLAMKSSAFLIVIGRSGVIDTNALITVLQDRKIGGAAIDVFDEEPLPPTSPLWKLPNTIITPHIGGMSEFYSERAVAMFMENLKRYLSGSALLNRYDPQRGY